MIPAEKDESTKGLISLYGFFRDLKASVKTFNQQPRRERRGCCSHKVVAVGFNTLRYDASVVVLNPPHE